MRINRLTIHYRAFLVPIRSHRQIRNLPRQDLDDVKGSQHADGSARIVWRVEPGVVGKLSACRKGWCKIDVRGKMGYIEAAALWGVDPDEREP